MTTLLEEIAPRLGRAHRERGDELDRVVRAKGRIGGVQVEARLPDLGDKTTRYGGPTVSVMVMVKPHDRAQLDQVIETLGGLAAFSEIGRHSDSSLYAKSKDDDRFSVFVELPGGRSYDYRPRNPLLDDLARRQREERGDV